MKKKTLLPFLLIAGSLATLAGCDSNQECPSCPSCDSSTPIAPDSDSSTTPVTPAHTHTKADSYSYDENGHYYGCKGCEENIRFDYQAHTYVDKSGVKTCSVCGYIPNDNMRKAFASLQKGLNAYLSDTTSSISGTMSMAMISDDVTAMRIDVEVNLTADVENAAIYSKQIVTSKMLNGNGSVAYSSTETNEIAYAKDSDNKIYLYEGDADSKKYYISDQNMVRRTFADDYSFDDGLAEYIIQAKSYEAFQEMLETNLCYQAAVRSFDVEQSAKAIEGGFEYSVSVENTTVDSYGEKDIETNHYTYIIKNDYLVSEKYEVSSIEDYKYGTKTEIKTSASVEFSSDPNEALYKTFDKTGYTDSGSGEDTKITVYYDDYEVSRISANIGKALSSTSYTGLAVTYGDYYYDKEFTKPYTGAAITGKDEALYIKPTVLDGEYGKVLYMTEICYTDPNGVFDPVYERKVNDAKDIGAGGGYTIPYGEDDSSNHYVAGEIYVNGVKTNDTSITVEKGKVYIVEYKRVEYMTSPFRIGY